MKIVFLVFLALSLSIITPSSMPVLAQSLEGDEPTIIPSPTIYVSGEYGQWKKDTVTLQLSGTGVGGASISRFILPNGNIVNASTTQYTVKENGYYLFRMIDGNGQIGYKNIKVDTIDNTSPRINISLPTGWQTKSQPINIQIEE